LTYLRKWYKFYAQVTATWYECIVARDECSDSHVIKRTRLCSEYDTRIGPKECVLLSYYSRVNR